jgi:dephospho-CoA kinase
MGCGKSTAARIFEELGFRRIDSDALVRERVLTSPEVIAEAERRFGAGVLDAGTHSDADGASGANDADDASGAGGANATDAADGANAAGDAPKRIDRAALAAVIFADDAKRLAWEAVVFPRVCALWRELLDSDPRGRWVVEAPLLYEKGLEKWFDFVVCVASSSATQLARLAERGVSHTLAGQRISKQLPLAQKIEKSDFVLSNDGSTDFLREQITHLASRLVACD